MSRIVKELSFEGSALLNSCTRKNTRHGYLSNLILLIFMVMNNFLKVMLTNDQSRRIKENAEAKGYKTVSAYIRALALDKDLFIESKIIENNKLLKEIKDMLNSQKID